MPDSYQSGGAIVNDMTSLARALCTTSKSVRVMFGVGTGANTVSIDGSTTEVTLPAINAITTGDYVVVIAWGADRFILGALT